MGAAVAAVAAVAVAVAVAVVAVAAVAAVAAVPDVAAVDAVNQISFESPTIGLICTHRDLYLDPPNVQSSSFPHPPLPILCNGTFHLMGDMW